MAGNDFLADWFGSVAPAVERVWTAIDTDRFTPAARGHDRRSCWAGPARDRACATCGPSRRPSGASWPKCPRRGSSSWPTPSSSCPGFPADRVELVPWSPATEATAIQGFDVGLMPLTGGDWAKGKCAFKMLQYLACAVPAVVSPVGMNTEVLAMADVGLAAGTEDEWVEALLALYRDRDRAAATRPQRPGARRARLLRARDRRTAGRDHAPLPMSIDAVNARARARRRLRRPRRAGRLPRRPGRRLPGGRRGQLVVAGDA